MIKKKVITFKKKFYKNLNLKNKEVLAASVLNDQLNDLSCFIPQDKLRLDEQVLPLK